MTVASKPQWLDILHPTSPFDGIDDVPTDAQGWGHDHPIFERLIAEVKPSLIVEVGTWKGASSLRMAELLKKYEIDGRIIAVDSWLGSLEQWIDPEDRIHGHLQQYRTNGHPIGLYCQFLANVKNQGFQDVIVPFPVTSTIAARWMAHYHIEPDLIYLDGGHQYEEVLLDLRLFHPLLSKEGIIFGDDILAWPGVKQAVEQFAAEENRVVHTDGNKWVLRRN